MSGIGFREAREMWTPTLINLLHEKTGGTFTRLDSIPEIGPTERPTVVSKQTSGDTVRLCVPYDVPYVLIKRSDALTSIAFYPETGAPTVSIVRTATPRVYSPGDERIVYAVSSSTVEGPTYNGVRYYDKFGFDRVEIPASCTRLTAIMPRAIELFNERYAYRMLNSETLEQWQIRLQHVADLNVYRYERALELYETNADEMLNVLEKTVTVREATTANSGTDSTTYGRTDTYAGTVKNVDTPDSAVNDSDDYADSLVRNNNSNTASGTDRLTHGLTTDIDDTVTETKEPEGGIIRATNDSIDAYRDLVADFVKEFENNFLNVFWY